MSLQLKATCLGAERGPGSWEGEPSLEPAPQGSQDRGRSLGEAGWGRSHGKCHFWDTPEWSQPRMELMAWGEQHVVGPGLRLTWDSLAEEAQSVPRALHGPPETLTPRWMRQRKGRGRIRKAESGQAGRRGNSQGLVCGCHSGSEEGKDGWMDDNPESQLRLETGLWGHPGRLWSPRSPSSPLASPPRHLAAQ